MANYKAKLTNFYKEIMENTEINKCGENYIFFSIDTNFKHINYIINEKVFESYIRKIESCFNKDIIELKEIIDILKEDIYKIYKTRVSEKRIPQIILNILVKTSVLYSDNGVDFEIKQYISITDIIKKINQNIL